MGFGFVSVLVMVGSAHAGFRADLEALAATGSRAGVACGSTQRALDGLAALADATGSALPDAFAEVRALAADPDTAVLAADGAFAIGLGPGDAAELRLHTDLPAAAVAERVAKVTHATVTPRDGGFDVRRTAAPDAPAIHIDAVGADVRVATAPAGAAGSGVDLASVLEPLPDLGPGCAVFARMDDPPFGPAQLSAYLPLDGAEAGRFVVRSTAMTPPTAVLPGLGQRTVAPEVHSVRAPAAWVSVGFGLVDLNLGAVLTGRELAQAERARRYLPVAPGTTLGAYFEPAPAFAAVVPVAADWPAARLLRHARRALRRLGEPSTRIGKGVYQLQLGSAPLVFGARTGALVVATDVGTLLDVRAGQGPAWLDDAARERAAGWLVAGQVARLPPQYGLPPLEHPLWMGLRVDGDRLVGEAVLPLGPGGWKALLQVLKSRAPGAGASSVVAPGLGDPGATDSGGTEPGTDDAAPVVPVGGDGA